MTEPLSLGIRLEGVRKFFGRQVALAGIELDIPQGSSVAIMGPNGSGKTTLLKVIAGLVTPTRGTVTVAGVEMRRAGPGLRRLVGYVSHETMLYPDLTAGENLLFHAKLFGLTDPGEAMRRAAGRLGVGQILDRQVRTLSRGTRQKVTLARALLHDPKVLLMDEPYTGLDEAASASLSDMLRELHEPSRTLVVTVHEVARALSGPERLVALDAGKVAMDIPTSGEEEEISRAYISLLRREVAV